VRVLGIDTSSQRGSVALVDGAAVVCALHHERPNAHAEELLPLVTRAFAEAGFEKSSIDKIAVGIGPGSFTGLRVGIALAEGMALGLDRPLVGVGSLRAMTFAVPASDRRTRVAVLDARREELFVAAHAADGKERLPPMAIPRASARAALAELLHLTECVFVGTLAAELGSDLARYIHPDADLPHARSVALLGVALEPDLAPPAPQYVRDSGATKQELPVFQPGQG
jgi:tRNA threonylcarbamoyl adenosine modification protein YeaZ